MIRHKRKGVSIPETGVKKNRDNPRGLSHTKKHGAEDNVSPPVSVSTIRNSRNSLHFQLLY